MLPASKQSAPERASLRKARERAQREASAPKHAPQGCAEGADRTFQSALQRQDEGKRRTKGSQKTRTGQEEEEEEEEEEERRHRAQPGGEGRQGLDTEPSHRGQGRGQ